MQAGPAPFTYLTATTTYSMPTVRLHTMMRFGAGARMALAPILLLGLLSAADAAVVAQYYRWFRASNQSNVRHTNGDHVECPPALACAIAAWGDATVSATPAAVTSPTVSVRNLYAIDSAFAALHDDGKVTGFGDVTQGGNAPDAAPYSVTAPANDASGTPRRVMTIAGTAKAFAAIFNTGEVSVWGDEQYGGATVDSVSSAHNGRGYTSWNGAALDIVSICTDTCPSSTYGGANVRDGMCADGGPGSEQSCA